MASLCIPVLHTRVDPQVGLLHSLWSKYRSLLMLEGSPADACPKTISEAHLPFHHMLCSAHAAVFSMKWQSVW